MFPAAFVLIVFFLILITAGNHSGAIANAYTSDQERR